MSFITLSNALPTASQAAQRSDSPFEGRRVLSVGLTHQQIDGSIQATRLGDDPLQIDLDDLRIDDRDNSYYLEYRHRLGSEWAIFAGAYSYSDSGAGEIKRDLIYNGVEFTAGAQLRSSMDVDAYIIDLMYRIYENDRVEVMLGAGLHALNLEADIGGRVQIDAAESEIRQSGSSLLAPVPNLRGSLDWVISKKLSVNLIVGWLSANVDRYDGAFAYAHLKASYRVSDTVGITLGYQVTDIDISEKRRFTDVRFDQHLAGPTFALSYSF